ncbi:MAG: PadR family transcriptional regulator [Gemmatimonadales bacterium]
MSRRKTDTLLSIEIDLLSLATVFERSSTSGFYGYQVAKAASQDGNILLVGHGTVYKALARLEGMGLLESSWEDPAAAEAAGRPRRRLYRITAAGALARSSNGRDVMAPVAKGRDAAPVAI